MIFKLFLPVLFCSASACILFAEPALTELLPSVFKHFNFIESACPAVFEIDFVPLHSKIIFKFPLPGPSGALPRQGKARKGFRLSAKDARENRCADACLFSRRERQRYLARGKPCLPSPKRSAAARGEEKEGDSVRNFLFSGFRKDIEKNATRVRLLSQIRAAVIIFVANKEIFCITFVAT